jgi:putative flippase GtrA
MKSVKNLLKGSGLHVQLIRYTIIAGIGLVADFGIVITFKQILGLYYLIGICCGFIVGLILTYILGNKYVFGDPKADRRKVFILFVIIGLVGLGILSLLEWILTSKLELNYILSKALSTIVVFAWNFIARKSLYKSDDMELPYEL